MGLELIHHDSIQFLFCVGHHCDEILVHRRPEPHFVLVRWNDSRVLIRQSLLQVAFELFFERVLLDVVDDADSDGSLLGVDDDKHRIVND